MSVAPNQVAPGVSVNPTVSQQTNTNAGPYGGVFMPGADGRFPVANVPPGYALYREHDNHIMRNTTSGVPLSATVNGLSVKGTKLLQATAGTQTLVAAGLTIVTNLQQVIIWASTQTVTLAYGGTAVGGIIIPTTPMALNISASDLALLQFAGTGNLYVVQFGFVAPI